MDLAPPSPPESHPPKNQHPRSGRKIAFGLAGMVLGFLGLLCSVGGTHIVEMVHPPEQAPLNLGAASDVASDFLADVAAKTSKKIVGKVKDKVLPKRKRDAEPAVAEAAPPPAATEKVVRLKSERERWLFGFTVAGVGLGIAALGAGLFGWVRGEDHRAAVSAGILGFIAMAWVYIVAAIALLIIAAIIASFCGT